MHLLFDYTQEKGFVVITAIHLCMISVVQNHGIGLYFLERWSEQPP